MQIMKNLQLDTHFRENFTAVTEQKKNKVYFTHNFIRPFSMATKEKSNEVIPAHTVIF